MDFIDNFLCDIMLNGKDILSDIYQVFDDKYIQLINGCTPQLFYHDGNDYHIPEPYASGIFLSIGEHRFLVTANHVLKNIENHEIGVIIENEFVPFSGLHSNFKDEELDIDLLIINLSDDISELIDTKYSFLSEKYLDINPTNTSNVYLLYGWPISKSKVRKDINLIKSKSWRIILSQADKKHFTEQKLKEETHIIINFDQKHTEFSNKKGVFAAPDPTGISGSGAWRIPITKEILRKKIELKLSGIMTTHKKGSKIVYGTKIGIVTEFIRQRYVLNIDKLNLLQINFRNK